MQLQLLLMKDRFIATLCNPAKTRTRRHTVNAMSQPSEPAREATDTALASERGRPPQTGKLKAAKTAMYREHIMDVAERLFAEDGFDHTRMQDIATAAGISLGTLYQSYSGKRALYRQLLIARDGEMLQAAMDKGRQVLRQPQSVEQLLWLTAAHIRFLLEHDDYLRIQLQEGYAWYHTAAQPSADEQHMWEQGIGFIQALLDWGTAQGHFVPGNTADQARLMITLQQTRLANWVMGGMRDAHDKVIADIQADFVRQFCRPQVAAAMLSADGAELSASTAAVIHALDYPEQPRA